MLSRERFSFHATHAAKIIKTRKFSVLVSNKNIISGLLLGGSKSRKTMQFSIPRKSVGEKSVAHAKTTKLKESQSHTFVGKKRSARDASPESQEGRKVVFVHETAK